MQKLFTAEQIRAWDQYTIANEPILSIDLMERASLAFVHWFEKRYNTTHPIYIYAGPGNNGGDGLAIARLLRNLNYIVDVILISPKDKLSQDCQINYNRLQTTPHKIVSATDNYKRNIPNNAIVIDSLFGSGLNKPLNGIFKEIVAFLNTTKAIKIALDIPSGMYCDQLNSSSDAIFKSDHTISFQVPKLAFFFEPNQQYVSRFTTVNIGLLESYIAITPSPYFYSSNQEPYKIDTGSEITIISYDEISESSNYILKELLQKVIQTNQNIELKANYCITATTQGKVLITKPEN